MTRRKPGLVISGRCITEAEFRREMREREAEQLEVERQKQEKKAGRNGEEKKREREVEKEKRMQERSVKDETQDRDVPETVDSDEQDEDEEYYCGECGGKYEEDGELWIGSDGGCEVMVPRHLC